MKKFEEKDASFYITSLPPIYQGTQYIMKCMLYTYILLAFISIVCTLCIFFMYEGMGIYLLSDRVHTW